MSYNLDAIIAKDPDGWDTMPTEADYERFEAWIVRTYGNAALDSYRGLGRSEDTLYEPWADDPINDGGWS